MVALQSLVSGFSLVGKLENLATKSNGRVKHLLLSDNQQKYWIKVLKNQPANLSQQLQIGSLLQVKGMQTQKLERDLVEYTAYEIKVVDAEIEIVKPKPTVLFCQAGCWRRGGKTACTLLQKELEQRGIAAKVEIKTVGCMKKCKQAPNVVILPERNNYSLIQPQQISSLVEQHFSELD